MWAAIAYQPKNMVAVGWEVSEQATTDNIFLNSSNRNFLGCVLWSYFENESKFAGRVH